MRRLIALWNCLWLHPYRQFTAAREIQLVFYGHGVKSTLFNCEVCGHFHLKGRS